MRWSGYFLPTIREIPLGTEAASHQLLLRAGLINMVVSGVYSYLPLGLRVLNRIQNIVREEMDAAGAQELFLPCLQPIELWKKTGRDKTLADVMIRFKDKRGKEMCLGPTHEEIITELVKSFVQSYRNLPVVLYQIQTKFRDEMRPRFGLVRACEFIMKDAYSFDRDKKEMQKKYDIMLEAYKKIFNRCGLKTVVIEADSGVMGGDVSHEFLVIAPVGEDTLWECLDCHHFTKVEGEPAPHTACPKCQGKNTEKKTAMEIGHIFQLGTKYSEALGAKFLGEDGKEKTIMMGCYGIGVSRLISAVVESYHDAAGIKWPQAVAPFDVEILPVQAKDSALMDLANQYDKELTASGLDVLMDDRDVSAGIKFNDADLVGIPLRIIIGKRVASEGKVEIKDRHTGEVMAVDKSEAVNALIAKVKTHKS